MSSTKSSRTKARWQGGPPELMEAAYQASYRLLSAVTAQEALTAVVDAIAGTADFCLVIQMGHVLGADLQITAVWTAHGGITNPPGTRLPYAMLAPFFEGGPPPAEGSVEQRGLATTIVTDVGHDERITPPFRQLLTISRSGSFVAVPVHFQGQARALFVVGRAQPGEYEPGVVRHYETIAEQLSGVLQTLDLLQQSRTRAAQLEVVAEISGAASSILDLAELLPLAVELIRDRFHLYYVGIFMLDPDRQQVTLRAGTGAAGQQMVEAGHHFAIGPAAAGEESMIGWCVAHRQPRIALDVGQEAAPGVQGFVRFDNPLLPDTRSELALPLITRGRLVGAMTIQSAEQAAFEQSDVTVLQVMADQLANAIENARFFQERERRMTQIGIVNEIGQALSTGLDLDVLFALVHRQVGRLFDADNFYIAVYEDGREFWELAFSVEQGQMQPPARHSVASGLTGWILRHRTAILLRSQEENAAFHEREGIPKIGPRACSWLGVPLIVSQKLVGAMGIQDYEQEYLYDESDQALFETVGAQVATVLDNARLLAEMRERAREMEVINEVGRVVTSVLDVDEVLRRLVDVTKEEFGYYFVSIALVSEAGLEIKYGSRIGDTDRRLEMPDLVLDLESPHSLVAECAQSGQPVLVGDVLNDPRYLSLDNLPDTRSELTVPIITRGRVIGTLDVQSNQPFAFDETELGVLQLLASQAGTAIENAQLFAETRRRADELGALHRVSLELAQEQRDLHTVLEALTRRTMDLLNSDGGGVWLWLDQESELELAITYQVGGVDFAGRRLKPGQGLTGRAFAHNEIQVIDDYLTWEGRSATFADAPFISAMAIPMTWQAETVGVLVSTRSQVGRPYRPEERDLGELLAAQAASVIQNARLFAEREARAEELAAVNEVGRAISSVLDLDAVLQQIVDTIKERFGHFFVGILLLEGSGPERCLVFRSSSTIGDTGARWQRGELRLALDGYGVTVAAVNTAISILVNDVRQDSRYGTVEGLEPVQAELDTPIKGRGVLGVKGEVIGVLTVQSDRLNAFDEGDVSLLQGLASQAGVAIDNARLFEQAQAQLSSLAQIQSALAELNAAFTLDEAISVLLPQVARIARADRVRIYLVDETQMTCVGVHSVTGSDSVHVGEVVSLDDYPLTKKVVETGQPSSVLSDDPQLQPHAREAYRAAGLAANATIPLIGRQGVVGVLSVNRQSPGCAFEEQEVSLVQTLANQATTVLEKNQLFEETEQRSAELQSLYETSLRISTHMETTQLLTIVVERAAALLGAETAGLYLYEPRANELVFSVAVGYLTEYVGRRLQPGEGLAGRVFQEGQMRMVDDYQAWAGRAAAYEQEQRLGMLLALPLVSGETGLGVLEIGVAKGRAAFKDRDIRLAELFAAQAAIALENARLFEESQRRAEELAVLNELGRALTARLDVAEVLQSISGYVSRLMKASHFYVALYEPETEEVSFPLSLEDGQERKWSSRRAGNGLTEYVIRTAEALLIRERVADYISSRLAGVEQIGQTAQSWLGAPMVIGAQVLGVIAVQSYDTPNLYTERDRDLLMAVASQAAIAVQNARLFEEAEARAQYERVVREITSRVRASTNPDTIMRAAVRELGAALDRPAFIRLGRPRGGRGDPAPTDARAAGGNGGRDNGEGGE
ncbi:MAG: GAF domain-containing protein [Anaerolineae bacterium]|nr:GAF domain-containing protein [Anaerolineae bacterium]